jgi:ribosomal protein S12 methylthiotransferase accessory factor
MWLNRLSMPRLSLGSEGWLRTVFDEKFARPGLHYDFIDTTTDIRIPTVSCLARLQQRDRVLFGVGAAANLDPREALLKAMIEATHTLVWSDSQLQRSDWSFDPTFANIRDFADHVRLYCEPEMADVLKFMAASNRLVDVNEIVEVPAGSRADAIADCVGRLESRGLDPILIEVTPPEVADLGLSIVKVMVPEAVGINASHSLRLLGGDRLYETPRVLGYTPHRTREEDLNPAPHPFP